MKNYFKVPTVCQRDISENGAAVLAMILAYFGKDVSMDDMCRDVNITENGCNAKDVLNGARKHGLECHAYNVKVPSGLINYTPCIIHRRRHRFLVLEGIKGNDVYINDPEIGRKKISMEKLEKCFSGVVMTFKPTNSFKRNRKNNVFSRTADITGRIFGGRK